MYGFRAQFVVVLDPKIEEILKIQQRCLLGGISLDVVRYVSGEPAGGNEQAVVVGAKQRQKGSEPLGSDRLALVFYLNEDTRDPRAQRIGVGYQVNLPVVFFGRSDPRNMIAHCAQQICDQSAEFIAARFEQIFMDLLPRLFLGFFHCQRVGWGTLARGFE